MVSKVFPALTLCTNCALWIFTWGSLFAISYGYAQSCCLPTVIFIMWSLRTRTHMYDHEWIPHPHDRQPVSRENSDFSCTVLLLSCFLFPLIANPVLGTRERQRQRETKKEMKRDRQRQRRRQRETETSKELERGSDRNKERDRERQNKERDGERQQQKQTQRQRLLVKDAVDSTAGVPLRL